MVNLPSATVRDIGNVLRELYPPEVPPITLGRYPVMSDLDQRHAAAMLQALHLQRAIGRVLAKRRGLAWLGFGLACHPWPNGTGGSDPDPGNPHDLATAPLTLGGAQ